MGTGSYKHGSLHSRGHCYSANMVCIEIEVHIVDLSSGHIDLGDLGECLAFPASWDLLILSAHARLSLQNRCLIHAFTLQLCYQRWRSYCLYTLPYIELVFL